MPPPIELYWHTYPSLSMKPQKLIAVVDDDPAMRKAISRLLNAHGFRSEVFSSAEAFLDWGGGQETACLVQLDGTSGLDLRHRLKEAGSQMPIVFITALDDEQIQREALAVGCVAYLRKPFPAYLLVGAIKKAVG